MPAVSIIMCAYNCEAYIGRAIDSIVAQTFTDWELLISDDASTDNTTEIIGKYLADNRIKLFAHQENLGYIRNKNFTFQQATGELLTQLDADDTCPPDRLAKQVAVFADENIHICGTNYNQVGTEDEEIKAAIEYSADFMVREIEGEYPFWFPGLMFRRNVVDKFGLFSEYFIGTVGDDEYWVYRVNEKYPVYFLKDVLYNYRIHGTSMTNVLDNPRKMIVGNILRELQRQRRETGTDNLEKGFPEKMLAFEEVLLSDKKLMGEKYRIWAAKAIDDEKIGNARHLLKRSFDLNKLNPDWYRTLAYYLRRK